MTASDSRQQHKTQAEHMGSVALPKLSLLENQSATTPLRSAISWVRDAWRLALKG